MTERSRHRRPGRWRMLARTGGLLLAVLASCVHAREVIVQLKWYHQFQFAGYYAALEQGYYDDAGLDVTLRPIEPGLDLVAEVTSGRADFAISNTGLLEAFAEGKPVVALAAVMQHSPGAFIGVRGRRIQTPADFIGARVMVPTPQQGGELLSLLNHLGIARRIQAVEPSYDLRDLIEGRVDLYNGYISNEPYVLRQHGLEPLIISPRDFGVDFYSDVLFTRKALVDSEPDTVEAFRQATLKGWDWALKHKEEMVRLILTRYAPNASADKLLYEANTLEGLMLSQVVDIGHMSRTRWRQIADQLAGLGRIPANLDLNNFLYTPQRKVTWAELYPWAGGLSALFAAVLIALTWVTRHNRLLAREVSERRRAEERAFYLATHDPLTDLPNRALMTDRLRQALHRARREGLRPLLMFMDLDNFKTVNDMYGHDAGDKVLQQVAYALRMTLRSADQCARFAGDEFVVLVEDCRSEPDAQTLASKLRASLQTHYAPLGLEVPIGISIGMLWLDGTDSVGSALRKADKLMYQAKRKGRNFNQFSPAREVPLDHPGQPESPGA